MLAHMKSHLGRRCQRGLAIYTQNKCKCVFTNSSQNNKEKNKIPTRKNASLPHFNPRVKLPIHNFHYAKAMKNDSYHLRREREREPFLTVYS